MKLLFFTNQQVNSNNLPTEMVERKGMGHPDTLADMVAETFCCKYSNYCIDKFGAIANHYVDKITLVGSQAQVDFGKSKIIKPINAYLFGKITNKIGKKEINIKKIFKGNYAGKKYPEGYSREDRVKIINYKNSDYTITLDYLNNAQHMFKGKLCSSGVNFFKININGDIQRCPGNRKLYGNILKGTFQPDIKPTTCTTTRVLSISQCNTFSNPTVLD